MQQNISMFDRYIRLTSGLVMYAGSTQLRRGSFGRGALLALGAMKVAEGVTGWCPLLYAFGVQTLDGRAQQAPSQPTQTTESPSKSDLGDRNEPGKQHPKHQPRPSQSGPQHAASSQTAKHEHSEKEVLYS